MKHFQTYKSLCTEFYDIDKPEAPAMEFAFYLDYASKANGRILEPMCGSGRFLIPIMTKGYVIDGIDASRYMLDSLRKKCERKNIIPLLHESMLQQVALSKRYSLVIIPSGSFCLLTKPLDINASLRNLYQAMLPHSKLVFELEMETYITEERRRSCHFWSGRWVKKQDGSLILLSTLPHYDEKTQIETTICKYELVYKNQIVQTEVEEFGLKLYRPGQIEEILTDNGFTDIRRYKLYEPVEASLDDSSVIIECTKGEMR